MTEVTIQLENLISGNKIDDVFSQMLNLTENCIKNSPEASAEARLIKREVILLSSQYHDIEKKQKYGHNPLLSSEKTHVVNSIMDIIDNFPKNKKFFNYLQEYEEEKNWEQVQLKNTFIAYNRFLKKYPKSKFTVKAKRKINALKKTTVSLRTSPVSVPNAIEPDLNDWWNHLPAVWKGIFRNKVKIATVPKTTELNKILKVRKLDITNQSKVKTLKPLALLKNLQTLNCSNTGIKNLNGISELYRLQTLWCIDSKIKSLNELNELQHLKELKCNNTPVSSLIPLTELFALEDLSIVGTNVKSLQGLENLKKMKELKLSYGTIAQDELDDFKKTHPTCKISYR